MDIFDFRNRLIEDYASYVQSFIKIRDSRVDDHVKHTLEAGQLWPEPLIQLNPSFAPGELIDELVEQGVLHAECSHIFRRDKGKDGLGLPLRLHQHQAEAIRTARNGHNYVLTTGTGSGKSLTYIVPIVDDVLRSSSGKGIKAIVVYPMNALANSQAGELEKFLHHGYPEGKGPVTFRRYTGQERPEERDAIIANPPDILLTNYVMLELILTRPREAKLLDAALGLRFLVLDELHTYRGRQGADVALLVRRVRDRLGAEKLQCVGTSATMSSQGSSLERQAEVAHLASKLFGAPVAAEQVIGETLQRSTPDFDATQPDIRAQLKERVQNPQSLLESSYTSFVKDPLSSWIESNFGITIEESSGRLVRSKPRKVKGDGGAAEELAKLTELPVQRCADVLQRMLLAGYTKHNPENNQPAFAFRLHQFISRGDTVYASPEQEAERYVTLQGQQFVPGGRTRVLLPLAFCRECGQEYYTIWKRSNETGHTFYAPRRLTEHRSELGGEAGFL